MNKEKDSSHCDDVSGQFIYFGLNVVEKNGKFLLRQIKKNLHKRHAKTFQPNSILTFLEIPRNDFITQT